MKITLTQPPERSTILLQIELSDVCTQISTSITFDPYEKLYIWLGKIRDFQLPASLLIYQENCCDVELIAERASNNTIALGIDLKEYGEDTTTHLATTVQPDELLTAFHEGITQLINRDRHPSDWSFIDNLSNINWSALLKYPPNPENWQKRLLMSKLGSRHGKIDWSTDPEQQELWKQLTPEQQWLIVLRDVLKEIAVIASRNRIPSIRSLSELYQYLPVDIALGEIDRDWYEERRFVLNREHELDKRLGFSQQEIEGRRILTATRLKMLRVGQIVDGTVKAIKPYGLFVNIGGVNTLLHISAISQMPVEELHLVFKPGDWVRAIILWMDIEKGRVSLSTSELEVEPGDMLKHPWKVYETAEEMALNYRSANSIEPC